MTVDLDHSSVTVFLDALASAAPAPGGGAACALTGALSAALVSMVANLTLNKAPADAPSLQPVLEQANALRERLVTLVAADAEAYTQVVAAYRLPRTTAEERASRRATIEAALQQATRVPLDIAAGCAEALALAEPAARWGSRSTVSDAGAAAYLAEAAARAALLNVEINLASIHDSAFVMWAQERAAAITASLPAAREAALAAMRVTLQKEV
ncbi:MAG: cyclodeaminase/cyclohydrolase family protein [Anaerolineales bacterium]